MGSKENFSIGDKIGDCTFKCEVPPIKKLRAGVFVCPECGNLFTSTIVSVKRKHTNSCGCKQKKTTITNQTTHGLSKHPLYSRWLNMKQRCFNSKNEMYKHYGGRDITMCDEWKNNFGSFYDYLMALPHALEKGYSIDRIDNDDIYKPNNVRWANNKTQQRNKHHPMGKSGHRGIYYVPHTNKWEARVKINGKYKTIGAKFPTKESAINAQKNILLHR